MDEYTTNLQARLDHILSEAYFGTPTPGGVRRPRVDPRVLDTSSCSTTDDLMLNVLWLIIGLVLGGLLCYYSFNCSEDQRDNEGPAGSSSPSSLSSSSFSSSSRRP